MACVLTRCVCLLSLVIALQYCYAVNVVQYSCSRIETIQLLTKSMDRHSIQAAKHYTHVHVQLIRFGLLQHVLYV
jgi:hypothetical protein